MKTVTSVRADRWNFTVAYCLSATSAVHVLQSGGHGASRASNFTLYRYVQ